MSLPRISDQNGKASIGFDRGFFFFLPLPPATVPSRIRKQLQTELAESSSTASSSIFSLLPTLGDCGDEKK
jgi:hypothetical protein